MKDTETMRPGDSAVACVLLVLLGAILMFPSPALGTSLGSSQGDPLVYFEPMSKYINIGELCTLSVMVDGTVDSLSCVEVYIVFDSTLVECTGAMEGELYDEALFPTFFRWQQLSVGTVTAVDCVLGYRSYIIAPGELTKFVFKGNNVGVCPVYFTSVRLWDIDRIELSPVAGEHAEIIIGPLTGVSPGVPLPGTFFNYPNPFNPVTVFVLNAPAPGAEGCHSRFSLEVYSVSGSRVRSLFDGELPPGRQEIFWDGKDEGGRCVPAGVYIAVASTDGAKFRRNVVIIR